MTVLRITQWNAPKILNRIEQAAANGINDTMADCVVDAKSNHGWQNRTGTAEASIRAEPAGKQGNRIVGLWGSFDVEYFIYLELGTAFMTGDHTLENAADLNYPSLADYIRGHL